MVTAELLPRVSTNIVKRRSQALEKHFFDSQKRHPNEESPNVVMAPLCLPGLPDKPSGHFRIQPFSSPSKGPSLDPVNKEKGPQSLKSS